MAGPHGVSKVIVSGDEPQITREVTVEYIIENSDGCRVKQTDYTPVYEGQSAMVVVENGFLNVVVSENGNLVADDYYPVESVLRVLNDAVDPA